MIWISVKEKLPISDTNVLVWVVADKRFKDRRDYPEPQDVSQCTIDRIVEDPVTHKNRWIGALCDERRVTHWMFLPKPPGSM